MGCAADKIPKRLTVVPSIATVRGCLKNLLHLYIRPLNPPLWGTLKNLLFKSPKVGDLGGQRKAVKSFSNKLQHCDRNVTLDHAA
jgi:hypothetical protein